MDTSALGLRSEADLIEEAKGLITFCDSPYVEKLGQYSMSVTGYGKLLKSDLNNMRGMLEKLVERHLKVKSAELLWSCFKGQKKILRGKGYSRSFLPCNARATNEYKDRHVGIYLLDRYPQSIIQTFLSSAGAPLNSDLYGLSEMIQWIWRLRIRDGKSIRLVIPSKRMRELLVRWLDGEFLLASIQSEQAA